MYSTVSIGPSHMENSIKFSTPFLPSLKGSSPTIHCGTFSFYCLLIFFIKKVQAPLKRYIISIIPAKPPHLLFFHFWQNSISRAPFFPHIGTPPQRYIQFQYSFELWCSSFNGIRTLTDWFINNFLFWWSPRFFIFDLQKKSPQKSSCISTAPHFPKTSPGDTWTQLFVTNFLRITTSKIYWFPQEIFLIACSNFKL